MGKKHLPDLPDTGRHYVENTIRARLASPGIERYSARKKRGALIGWILVLAAAAVAAFAWLR